MSFFQHPDDEHDEAVLAAARADAAAAYIDAIADGKPEALIPIEDIEGMPKAIPLLQMLTWIGQDEAAVLLKACSLAMTGGLDQAARDKQALQYLRDFVEIAAKEYANGNVN